MLLALVFILLLVWAAVVGSLYSNFIVFYKSFAEIDNYNKAYYASIAALERWELVTKQREPGYVWSGWRRWTTETVYEDDEIDSVFSYLIKSDDTNLLRDVNSKTNRVPRIDEWDVDWMLADSKNYNRMDYEDAEVFLLYVDDLEDTPYTKKLCSNVGDCNDVQVTITWQIRLPPKTLTAFWWTNGEGKWYLNNGKSLVVLWNKDDEIVDWQLRWIHDGNQFTIFAKNKAVTEDGGQSETDSVIRESDINYNNWNWVNLNFWSNAFSRQPNVNKTKSSKLIIISKEDDLQPDNFSDVLNPSGIIHYSRLNLRLSLLNLLESKSEMLYPYLEYYLAFDDYIADKYFRIDGEWRYKDYQVNIIMYKPTVKESVLWNFTVIF